MFSEHFKLDEQTMQIVEQIGRHMPGGFFLYKAEQPEELLYANQAGSTSSAATISTTSSS